jgi:excisionase family DNA binding protein
MFWTVKKASRFLGLKLHQVYYLLVMGEIEAVKIGKQWRVVPASAGEYGAKKAA